ncbi:MAG: acyl carrier protein [Desulfobacteraceae bacterium]|jgi:acyl carrier protein
MTIEDKVKRTIAEKLKIDIEDVIPEANFINDLGANSLDIVELIMTMEDLFDIEIEDDQAEKLMTVKDVLDFLKTRV